MGSPPRFLPCRYEEAPVPQPVFIRNKLLDLEEFGDTARSGTELQPPPCAGAFSLSGWYRQLHVLGSGERDERQRAVLGDLRSKHVLEVVRNRHTAGGGRGLYLFANLGSYTCLKKHGGCIFLTTLASGDCAHVPIVAFVCIHGRD